jgi:hypothetical protein
MNPNKTKKKKKVPKKKKALKNLEMQAYLQKKLRRLGMSL